LKSIARAMRKLGAASLSALLEIAFAQRRQLPALDEGPAVAKQGKRPSDR